MTKWGYATSVAALLAASLSPAQAATHRLVGVVTRVDREPAPSVQMTAKGLGDQIVHIDAKTAFVKWVTHKPWQQDTRADMAGLAEGRCVEIVLRSGPGAIANRIRISDEPAGSLFDPCKVRRQPAKPATVSELRGK